MGSAKTSTARNITWDSCGAYITLMGRDYMKISFERAVQGSLWHNTKKALASIKG